MIRRSGKSSEGSTLNEGPDVNCMHYATAHVKFLNQKSL
ncbi:unnamed protein product [Rhodiola kirilowii]